MIDELQRAARGDRADYLLGTPLGWRALDVARFSAREAIGETYTVDLAVVRRRDLGGLTTDELVGSPATLQIATEARWRPLHGLLTSVEEVDRTPTMQIFRVRLEPRWALATHRLRHRSFVDRPLSAIVAAVLENRDAEGQRQPGGLDPLQDAVDPPDPSPSFSAFDPPRARFRFAVSDRSRLDDPALRPFVVQYGETDHDFVARLLEEEGLSTVFEQSEGGEVLTITDRPGSAPLFERDERVAWRAATRLGTSRDQEVVRNLRRASRVRPSTARVRDFDFKRSHAMLEREALRPGPARGASVVDGLTHFAYPGRDEASAAPGEHPSRVRLERLQSEARLTEGWGSLRVLEPGRRVRVHDVDVTGEEEELLVTVVETEAVQLALPGTELDEEPRSMLSRRRAAGAPEEAGDVGYVSRFEALPMDATFRPRAGTAQPRIWGIQPAKVTAEELPSGSRPEIHCDDHGRVRVRFPWDQRPDRDDGTPSSDWVRVSQPWAGTGFGGMFVPRVGQEVLVAFEQGDPDRPVIVGRVYDVENPLPYELPARKTVSTIKSQSSPDAQGFNELRFEDLAGEEQVFLHAQKNLDEVVLANHSTTVGGSQSNSVAGSQSNSVGGSRSHSVGTTETTSVGTNQTNTIGAFRRTDVGANDDLAVGAWRNTKVGAGENRTVTGPDRVVVTGGRTVDVTGTHKMVASAEHQFHSPSWAAYGADASFHESASFLVRAGGCELRMEAGVVTLTNGVGAMLSLVGGIAVLTGAATVHLTGGVANVVGSSGVKVTSAGNVDVKGALIKLNG